MSGTGPIEILLDVSPFNKSELSIVWNIMVVFRNWNNKPATKKLLLHYLPMNDNDTRPPFLLAKILMCKQGIPPIFLGTFYRQYNKE